MKVFALLLILQCIKSRCLNGCLRCSEDYKCIYCDIQNGYQLREGRCYLVDRKNCLTRDDQSRCVMCEENYYLDQATMECVELDPRVVVENCKYHLGPQRCQVCQERFYLKNGGCIEIQNKIDNCILQNERNECLKCSQGNVVSIDLKSCIPVESIDNCLSYTQIKCEECQSSYLFNENYYLDLLFQRERSSSISRLTQYNLDVGLSNFNARQYHNCQKKQVDNCAVFETFNTCKYCVNGYYVNKDKQCTINPQPVIDHCQRYDSVQSCIRCDQGYLLKSSTECERVIPIENCFLYNTTTSTTICTRCYNDYYLSAENLCTKRTDISNIALCKILSKDFEKCEKCQNGFIPTSDGFRCLGEIQNCSSYKPTDKQSIRLECDKCDAGYYYNTDNRLCVEGEIEFCKEYDFDTHQCAKCKEKYYLLGNTCQPHKQLSSCINYSKNKQNECSQCDPHNFLFSRPNSCFKVDVVPNCQEQDDKSKCAQCEDGYYLRDSFCYKIPLEENCLQKHQSNCVKCVNDYYLHQGRCVNYFEYETDGCQANHIDGQIDLYKNKCNKCRENYVPFDLRDTFACVKKETIKEFYIPEKNKILNYGCEQMIWNDQTQKLICIKCKKGLVLDNDQCMENCVHDDNKLTVYRQWVTFHNKLGKEINDSFRIERVNICEKTIPHCAIAQLDVYQDFEDIRYSCERCMNGYLPIVDNNLGGVVRRQNKEMRQTPLTTQSSVICVEAQNQQVIGHKPDSFIEYCEYYHTLIPDIFGCLKCMDGYTGKTVQLIENCELFENELKCASCKQGYYLKSKQECRPVTRIQHCLVYKQDEATSVCKQCETNYYYDGATKKCLMRENSLNKENCSLDDSSDVCNCNGGYILHQNNCVKLPDNCQSATQVINGVPFCQSCDNSVSYLNNTLGTCHLGTVQNCQKFIVDKDECQICKNGFYMSGKFCLSNTPNLDQFCDVFNKTIKNECTTCQKQATKFQKLNECQAVINVDPNCELYEDKYRCKTCKQNYYLNNVSKRCLAIPVEMNCLDMEVVDFTEDGVSIDDYLVEEKYLHTCNLCKEHFMRRATQVRIQRKGQNQFIDLTIFKCQNWLNYMIDKCEETDFNGLVNMGEAGCYGCQTNYFPYDWTNKFICLNSDYLRERKNGYIYDSNCERFEFDYDNQTISCTQCTFPTFLKDGECVTDCGTDEAIVLDVDNGIIKRNVCKTTAAIVGCKYQVIGHAFNDNSTYVYGCYQCEADQYPVRQTAGDTQTVSIINSLDGNLNIQFENEAYPTVDCVAKAGKTLRGVVNGDEIDQCSLYYVLDGANAVGCFRCKQGYRGRVLFNAADTQGYLESCEVFEDCDTEMGGLSSHQNLPSQQDSLSALLSCQKCKNDKVLVAFYEFATATDVKTLLGLNQFQLEFTKETGSAGVYKNTDATYMVPEDLYQMMCIDAADLSDTASTTTAVYYKHATAPTEVLPDNCGIHAVNILATGEFTTAKVAIGCLSCKAGYKIGGYHAGDYDNFISSCDAITVDGQTCPTAVTNGTQLNNCDCIRKLDENTNNIVIDYADKDNECVKLITDEFGSCFAGVLDGANLKCKICLAGYELGDDGKCYSVQSPTCQNVNYWDQFNTQTKIISSYFLTLGKIADQQKQSGCISCSDPNHILYKVVADDQNLDTRVCSQEFSWDGTTTSYVDDTYNVFLNGPNNTNYVINNCVRYGYSKDKYICVECAANTHFLTADHQCAEKATELYMQNCKVGLKIGSSVCVECNTGYVNVGGLCRDKTDANDPYIDVNCQDYANETNQNYKGICSKCKTGYYASSLVPPYNVCKQIPATETNCVDYLDHTGCITCEDGYGLIDIKEGRYSNKQKRTCVKMDYKITNKFDHDPNCTKFVGIGDLQSLIHQRLKCQECTQNYVLVDQSDQIDYKQQCYQVVTPIPECKTYESPTNDDILTTKPNDIKFKTFRCTECNDSNTHYLDDVNNQCVARTNISQCKTYDVYHNRCVECQFGYKLKLDGSQCVSYEKQQTLGYMDTCRPIEQCSDQFYEGLTFQQNLAFTCHKCIESDEIPFATGLEQYLTPIQYGSNYTPTYTVSIDKQSQTRCLKPINSTFGLAVNDFVFPSNCGLGFIDLNPILNGQSHNAQQSSSTTVDRNKATIRCSKCKPGFKPTIPNYTHNGKEYQLQFMVSSCTAIANCESSEWFNACSQCTPGYAYKYDNKKGIQFDNCIAVGNNKYCESFDSDTNRCVYCQKGSILNADGYCEQLLPFKCQYKNFRYKGFYEGKDIQKGVYSDFVVGCNQCNEGYVALFVHRKNDVCLYSHYHQDDYLIDDTFYIKNCKHYQPITQGGFICLECQEGYVRSHQGKCYNVDQLSNCEIASTPTLCDKCQDGFVLVNRACVAKEVSNCSKYSNNRFDLQECRMCSDQFQLCIECEKEYYLSVNKCYKGEVENCEHLETAQICNRCSEGYQLVLMRGGKSYCYPIDNRYNCKKFNNLSFQSQQLECEQCVSGYVKSVSQTDRSNRTCMKFDITPNCKEYDNNDISLANSTYICVECERAYYLQDEKCLARVNLPDECIDYNKTKDECEKCEIGYFLSSSKTECLPYPQGIAGCEIYETLTKCKQCAVGFYKNNDRCVKIDDTLPNCKRQLDKYHCQVCDDGYLLFKGTCLLSQATGCLKYKSELECDTCPNGFALEKTENIINCVATTIPNCLIVNDIPPYDCIKCEGTNYLADGSCVQVTNIINKCLEYLSATQCAKCEPKSTLSTDKTLCLENPDVIRQIDLNCQNSFWPEKPICNVCKPGYVLDFGECIKCDENLMSSGCYQCDPNEPNRCLMCSSGFIQTPEGDCVRPFSESQGLQDSVSI